MFLQKNDQEETVKKMAPSMEPCVFTNLPNQIKKNMATSMDSFFNGILSRQISKENMALSMKPYFLQI